MEIVKDERTYEGLHAVPAMVMAMMEEVGIRELIDERCSGPDRCRHKLSSGMAVKALVGGMVERGKRPLYRMVDYYSTAPTDLLFGDGVGNRSLSDTILAGRLDDVFQTDTRSLLKDSYDLLKKRYGFEGDCLFMDATNYTMYGEKYLKSQLEHDLAHTGVVARESPMPARGGNAKDGHNDRVQMNLSHVVDGNGIPICSQSYDGNTSDISMNEDMIGYLSKTMDLRSYILMADCKMCVEDLLKRLMDLGTGFVTKVPSNFNDTLRDTVVTSVLSGRMDGNPSRPGRLHYETRDRMDGRILRVIAYMTPRNRKDSERFIREKGLRTVEKRLDVQSRKRYHCERDALEAFREVLAKSPADCYTADPVVFRDRAASKRHGDGREYRVRSENIRIDESRFEQAVVTHALQVLVTNLPFSATHSDDVHTKASADDVIDLYLELYKVEAGFKMMKSGMNIADVYIHTPSRITVVAFVVSLATMICKTMDHVLNAGKPKGERARTVKVLADLHANTLIRYDRSHDRMTVMGHPGATTDVFTLLERLSVDPLFLLGHR